MTRLRLKHALVILTLLPLGNQQLTLKGLNAKDRRGHVLN